jgi:agmatine/peptidylarginine deiminase
MLKIQTIRVRILFLLIASVGFPAFAQNQENEIPLWKRMHYLSEEEMNIKSWDNRAFVPTDPAEGPIYNVAEFAQMQGVLVRYPFGIPISLIAEMSEDVTVTTIVQSAAQENTVRGLYQSGGVNLAHCDFLYAPSNSYWTRDYGPWFIIDGDNKFGIVDFPYNRPRPDDDNIPVMMANFLDIPWYGMDVVHTGGNYMTDFHGKSSSTTLVYEENDDINLQNPPITPEEVDSLMNVYLGINTYHVVEDPLGDYIEHIDCWGKFLDVDKVLIGQVPSGDPRYSDFEAVASYFESHNSGWGNPYEVYRVYTPGNSPETPYTNSLIVNNKVFVPQTGHPYDDEAISTYEAAMPGYEIIGVYAEEANDWLNTDAIHCRVIGIADLGTLWVHHTPLWGSRPQQEAYEIEATVIPLSGSALISNSVKVYYKINSGNFTPLNMTSTNDTLFTASIPGGEEGDMISYYIKAQDQSGRTAFHPYIGDADPHTFTIQVNYYPNIGVDPGQIVTSCPYGSSSSEQFTITNSGNMQLNYALEANTLVHEYFDFEIPDSPDASSWTYNTYEELGWTDLNVEDEGMISNWTLVYTWSTLYPGLQNGGSFWVESPAGTVVQISGNIAPGTYTKNLNNFNGENMQGNWKLWITDSNNEGGHEATNMTLTIRKTTDPGQWLTVDPASGFVTPGAQTGIDVTCNAAQLAPGAYNGQILITSNDPDQPEITLPVTFTVGEMPFLTVTPDSLIFLTYEQMNNGQEAKVLNPTGQDIQINYINNEGMTLFYWYIEPWAINLPYTLTGGDSLLLNVHIAMPVASPFGEMWYDTLYIESEYDLHKVFIGVDSDLMSGIDPGNEEPATLSAYPNPFSSKTTIQLNLGVQSDVTAEILDHTGRLIRKIWNGVFSEGVYRFEWEGDVASGIPLPSGLYLVMLRTDHLVTVKKVILSR